MCCHNEFACLPAVSSIHGLSDEFAVKVARQTILKSGKEMRLIIAIDGESIATMAEDMNGAL